MIQILLFFSLIFFSACTSSTPCSGPDGKCDGAELVARGKQVYQTNCIACHNPNPAADGPLGPAVQGSSKELLEARVLRGEYPSGYQPKRPSKMMQPLPHLKNDIEALWNFLSQQN